MTNEAVDIFRSQYGIDPSATVRAPGRVNLIGDHTDYSLLPVLPMAIGLGIDVAGVESDEERVVAVSETYDGRIEVSTSGGTATPTGWGVYLHGALAVLGERATSRGARLAVRGDLPTTGGLSSSSALTVGILVTLDTVWGLGMESLELVDLAIVAERISGVESGGMDQTVIAMAEAGSALRIDFEPRALRPVPIPSDARFVIGYSGSPAAKAAGARDHYNRSVVACRAAAAILGRALGIDAGSPPLLGRLSRSVSGPEIDDLPAESTASEVARDAGVDLDQLVQLTGGVFPADGPVHVRAAARHVFAEARRVDVAESALLSGESTELGRLFDESHSSLREFGSVTPGLDRVTAAARDSGAFGARVTGAGFGGWAVAVCPAGEEARVAAAMFKATGGPAFAVVPSAGALA